MVFQMNILTEYLSCVPGGNKKIDLCLPLSTEIIHIQSQQLQQNKSEVLEAVESSRSKPQKNGKKQLVPITFFPPARQQDVRALASLEQKATENAERSILCQISHTQQLSKFMLSY